MSGRKHTGDLPRNPRSCGHWIQAKLLTREFIGTSGIRERGTGKQAGSDQITKPLDAA
jgi:hypothetical protein